MLTIKCYLERDLLLWCNTNTIPSHFIWSVGSSLLKAAMNNNTNSTLFSPVKAFAEDFPARMKTKHKTMKLKNTLETIKKSSVASHEMFRSALFVVQISTMHSLIYFHPALVCRRPFIYISFTLFFAAQKSFIM